MPDTITKIGSSTVQHGPENHRVYLMKLAKEDCPEIIEKIRAIADEHDYSKIFAKVPSWGRDAFAEAGYDVEAEVPRFFNGEVDAFFMSLFIDPERREEDPKDRHEKVVAAAKEKKGDGVDPLGKSCDCRICEKSDIPQMVEVYREVFDTYPFPITEEDYLAETMETHVVYFGVWQEGKLVALSSAEMDEEAQNVEMTDFATLPDFRGQGFAANLLECMEDPMRQRDIRTAYTIARAVSFGMNITFAKLGYTFSGRLVNNTNISGGFESMNVWYKPLDK